MKYFKSILLSSLIFLSFQLEISANEMENAVGHQITSQAIELPISFTEMDSNMP